MNLVYKYINFKLIEKKSKTYVYYCYNNKSNINIGVIRWYGPWRQYCYFPGEYTIFSKGCLEDIISFICELNEERKIRNVNSKI